MYEVDTEALSQMDVNDKYQILNEIDFLLENIDAQNNVICEKNKVRKLLSIIKGDYDLAASQIIIKYSDIVSCTYKIQRILVNDIRNIKENLLRQGDDISEIQESLDLIIEIMHKILPDIAEATNKNYSPLIEELNDRIRVIIKRISANQSTQPSMTYTDTPYKIGYNPIILFLTPSASYLLTNGEWKSIHFETNLSDYYFSNIDQVVEFCKKLKPDVVVTPDMDFLRKSMRYICSDGFPDAYIINVSDFYAYLWFWNMPESLKNDSEIAIIDHYDTMFSGGGVTNSISTTSMMLKKYTVANNGTSLIRYDYGYSFNYADFTFMIKENLGKTIGKNTRIIRTFKTDKKSLENKLNKMNIFPLEHSYFQLLSGEKSLEHIEEMLDIIHSLSEQ